MNDGIKKLEKIITEESKNFKIHHIDNGFCRIVYKAKNSKNQIIYYCLQDEGVYHGGVLCYRTSTDFEPDYRIDFPKNMFEIPMGDSEIEKVVREYLSN